jgi:hypothetical protein
MPSIKLDLTEELAEKIERDTLDNGSSRAKVIQHAIEWYYSSSGYDIDLLKKELEHKDKLLEIQKEEYTKLNLDFEWLKGEYSLVTTKLLPAAEPWWVRLRRRFRKDKSQ